MSDQATEKRIIAELKVGSKKEKVTISQLSMTSCVARVTFSVRPYQIAILRLYEIKENGEVSAFKSIKSTIESYTHKKSDPKAFYAKIKFSGMVGASQGIVQLMHLGKNTKEIKKDTSIPIRKNSLRIVSVSCRMCSEKHIPFWVLQSRSMITKANIFEVPSYVEAMPGRDFCDYNLLRVIVCPNCFFASSYENDFEKETRKETQLQAPFDKETIVEKWMLNISKRKKLLESHLDGFFGEDRNVKQALLSYDLAIITNDAIFEIEEAKDEKRRDYNMARKSVFYQMFKAELLMTNNQPEAAQKLLKETATRLEEIFPYLNNEPSIRAGFLLGMLSLYFEEYRKVGQYLTFLRSYNQEGILKEGSAEYKTLMTNIKKLDEAFQSREEYSKTKLTRFQKPF